MLKILYNFSRHYIYSLYCICLRGAIKPKTKPIYCAHEIHTTQSCLQSCTNALVWESPGDNSREKVTSGSGVGVENVGGRVSR